MARELIAVLILAACNSAGQSRAAEPAPKEPAAPFRVEVTPPASCVAGSACEARIELTALGAYKINDQYPFKFVADPGLAVAIDGTGTFAQTAKQTGTLTVRLRPGTAGTARVTGTFKLSVCTPENCEIEEPAIAFDVPVTGAAPAATAP